MISERTLNKLPVMNLPEKTGNYNVIQLYIGEKPYLRFGEKLPENVIMYINDRQGHKQIVKSFLEELKLDSGDFREEIGNGEYVPLQIPVLPSKEETGIDFKLVGAGTCAYEPMHPIEELKISFFGRSIKYNRMICSYHLMELNDEFKEHDLKITINDVKLMYGGL
ncbi:MAG: hypothetical protein ACP5N2_00890 [Candidatus Nanoarchaeia archaeon]